MIKINFLRVVVVMLVTVLLAVAFGYLVSIAIKEISYNAIYKDKIKAITNLYDGYFDSLIEKLENEGLISARPSIEAGKTKGYVNQKMSFSLENFNFEIALNYQVFNDALVLTVSVSESETVLSDIDAFKNEKVNCFLSILDECFETESFNKSSEFCDTDFLIENHNSNKNDNGITEYDFATHDTIYDASCLHKTETVYSYRVFEFNSGYEYKALIKYNV